MICLCYFCIPDYILAVPGGTVYRKRKDCIKCTVIARFLDSVHLTIFLKVFLLLHCVKILLENRHLRHTVHTTTFTRNNLHLCNTQIALLFRSRLKALALVVFC